MNAGSTGPTPDLHGEGLTKVPLDPLRYETPNDDAYEASGILKRYMPSNCRVLDVGCGAGSVTLIANQNKNNVVLGIEPDPTRVELARARGIHASCGFLDSAYLKQHGPFDVILLADVLEHLANPAEMLALATEGLKPSGLLLISVPNAVHWTMRWQMLWGRFELTDRGIRDATHLRWFTEATLTRLLESCGFEVLETGQSAGYWLPEYSTFWPWKWLKLSHRAHLVRRFARLFPLLFGCQHVVNARRR